MTDRPRAPSPTRVIAYADGEDLDASRAFYTDVLGFEVAMEDPVLGLTSPAGRGGHIGGDGDDGGGRAQEPYHRLAEDVVAPVWRMGSH